MRDPEILPTASTGRVLSQRSRSTSVTRRRAIGVLSNILTFKAGLPALCFSAGAGAILNETTSSLV